MILIFFFVRNLSTSFYFFDLISVLIDFQLLMLNKNLQNVPRLLQNSFSPKFPERLLWSKIFSTYVSDNWVESDV